MALGAPSVEREALDICVVVDGQRREMTIPSCATLREVKVRVATADGYGNVGRADQLFGAFVHRGRKLDDSGELLAAGVQNRDKVMLNYLPQVRDMMTALATIGAENLQLKARKHAGDAIHQEELTRQALKLDALDFTEVPDGAREILRSIRKQELAHIELIGH